MDFKTRYKKLNDNQRQAVDQVDGPVMVIAGPGTGKTELLSMRTANILRQTDALPENILCLTFTDSGANAMRERLTQIIGVAAYKVAIHTFHSFGSDVISQNGQYFYQGAHFRPADELSSYELLHTIFDELDHNNPLTTKMNGEYTHLNDALTTISELKRSGLTSDELLLILDANDGVIDTAEQLLRPIFAKRIDKKTTDQLLTTIEPIRSSSGDIRLATITPLSKVLADSLAAAVSEATEQNSTKPVTAWRSAWMKKNDTGEFILKSRDRQAKLRAVSFIYYQYLARMQEAELYDFDDMILRVVHAMEIFSELRLNLQEKYQYIMVDEFQDTNMAQMRIIYNLTDNEVSGGRPNIMVVGDDDQAIYSFQGADVSNISHFRDTFPTAPLITLTDNYRSTPEILSSARDVITLGTDRLENRIAELNKTLTAHRQGNETSVSLYELPTVSDERAFIVDKIAASIKNGAPAGSIAVLARRHHEIIALLPYFSRAKIAVNYDRQDNVLELDLIKVIEQVSQILIALFEQRHQDADSLLPELLSHPAFNIKPIVFWRMSISAKSNHQSWMEIMAVTPELEPLHSWLITQAQSIPHQPLEYMLDNIMGINQPDESTFISPLYSYYFNDDNLAKAPNDYLTYLEALRTIRGKLREYQPEETPTLTSFIEFIRLHRQRGSTITSIRTSAAASQSAVQLMTAHKAKGLEYDTVYIVGAVDSAWGERVRSRSRLIGYPENLPLAPVGDSIDERLRLFFVAMTRAKKQLIISYSQTAENGKSTLRASFLSGDNWQAEEVHPAINIEQQIVAAELQWYQPIVSPIQPAMRDVLAPILDNYKLSVTHLNNFLDVSRGGPQTFLMQNLLRFPQAISPSAGYGTAIHAALQRAHAHLAATGSHRPHEDILRDFEESLRAQHLPEENFQYYLQKGSDTLSAFLDAKYDTFNTHQKVEVNFAHQAVFIGDAHLTGSLDLIDINDDSVVVTDYKTGKPSRSWVGKTDFEKIKLHKYKQQLMFYELMLNHSRDFAKYQVGSGVLQFVEPTSSGAIVALEASFNKEECERFARLIQVVWQHIITLDLPDTSSYDPSYKGMLEFEAWLLDERT